MAAIGVVVGVLSAAAIVRAQTPIYVDPDATGPIHDGLTWCKAYTDLQTALTDATEGTEIHVAAGAYKPTTTSSRDATFQLKSGVAIYGGFAGCGEPDPDRRDLLEYETILSGDLAGNDDPAPISTCCSPQASSGCDDAVCEANVCARRPSCCAEEWDRLCSAWAAMLCCDTCGSTCENSYHVVTGWLAEKEAVLDGFTVTGGYADDSGASLTDRGAAIYNYFIRSSPTIANCIIRGNTATGKGAGAYNHKTTATFVNCVFSGNIAPNGAAMTNFSTNGSPTLRNCTVSGNTATTNQGGIWNANSDPDDIVTLTNCILWDNADTGGTDESAQMNATTAQLMVDYSSIQGWTGLFGGTNNNGNDPLFVDALGPDGAIGTPDDDLRLSEGSPAINTSDPAFVPEPDAVDVAGLPRLQGCRVDRGAFESDAGQRFGDFDADDVVTLADYAFLQRCFSPAVSGPDWPTTCLCVFDDDGNEDIDLDDFAAFHAAFNAP